MITRHAIVVCLFLVLAPIAPDASALAGKDEPAPIVVEEPHYGEVLFYFYQEDYFPAIVRVLAAEEQGQLERHAAQAELLKGGLYLSYGHHLEAAEIFERLLANNVNPEIRDRTWFFLAKIWRQRGYLDKAQRALDNIGDELPEDIGREARMLQAQLLIDGGEFDRAIALLQDWKGKTEWSRYAQFNLGVALVRSGRMDEAKKILEELGDIDPWNEELTSLRDKANLALGYALLQSGQPHAAKMPLQRVRLEGPFSNKALLGVGWADAELERYQRALVPWMELRGRDLLDPAVQESMLAIPYALAQLDSISQAADHYVNAVEAFYEEANRIERTIDHIESGRFFDEFISDDPLDSTGWYWRLQSLPEGPQARYLFHLLATHEFQEGLKNYRDLNYLWNNLDRWQQRVEVYANMLETRRLAYEKRLPQVQEALSRADIDGMVQRKLEFDALLNDIEQSGDWLALADKREFEMWGEITSLEKTPALNADIPEADEVRDKIRLLKGVLQWSLEKDFKERLWRIRRDLRETGEALVETQRARRQVDDSMQRQPVEFRTFDERVYGLEPRIEVLKMRVGDAMAEQRAFLQAIAVGELQAQQRRLDTYTVQARFALAAIYDRAATVTEAAVQ
ncbi:MAG TPA: tetratricopeptide repeat protein [Woeseiaceae bacterium]|nr:tetratricopeptide repeat protein [Woeseiaceae bacterium]